MGEIQFSIKQSMDELVQLNKSVTAYQEIREAPGVIGLLGELIDVQPQLYIAVENALGSQLCNIVVDTQEHGMQVIEKLRSLNRPEFANLRVNFLILEDFEHSPVQPASFQTQIQSQDNVVQMANVISYIQVDVSGETKTVKPIVDHLLQRVVIVRSLALAN